MKSSTEIKNIAQECIKIEIDAVYQLIDRIDNDFVKIIQTILMSNGKIVVAGIGKSANIAKKIVATFNSTGQRSVFLHLAEAVHGDLGNIQKDDIVICISKSGNTKEIKSLIPIIKEMGNLIIAMTGNLNSYISRQADFILDVSVKKEACPNDLAPTSSSTVQLVMGDAIAICLLTSKGFNKEDFARFHPGGTLGKRLSLRLIDLLPDEKFKPKVQITDSIDKVIIEISNKRLGATAVLDHNNLIGIITDGDLRRMLENQDNISQMKASDIMSKKPITMDFNTLAYDALNYMQENSISQIVVVKKDKYIGMVHLHDIVKEELL